MGESIKTYPRCGIEGLGLGSGEQAMVKIEAALNCPVSNVDAKYVGANRFGITRVTGTYDDKKDMMNGLKHILSVLNKLARVFLVGERTFHSSTCCDSLHSFYFVLKSGWTKDMVSKCCAKAASLHDRKARCDPRRPHTCIKLTRVKHELEKGRGRGSFWVKQRAGNKWKCGPRELDSGGMWKRGKHQELGDAAEWWGRRRRRGRRRSCGWICKVKRKAKRAARWVKKKVKKLGGRAKSFFITKAIKIISRVVPRKFRRMVKAMLPEMAKGNVKKAIAAASPLITKLILSFIPKKAVYRPTVKYLAPYYLKGKPKTGTMQFLQHIRSVLLYNIVRGANNIPIFVDCKIKQFALPLVDFDYDIKPTALWPKIHGPGCCINPNKSSNFLDSRKGCPNTHRGLHKSSGPFKIKLSRLLRRTGKEVCSFTFTGDSFYCHNRHMNCCSNWAYSQPRFTTSDYQPSNQQPGHNCKAWYLSSLQLLQALWTVGTAASHIQTMIWAKCFSEQCESSNNCSPRKCNQNPHCHWSNTKRPDNGKTWRTEKVGWCKMR